MPAGRGSWTTRTTPSPRGLQRLGVWPPDRGDAARSWLRDLERRSIDGATALFPGTARTACVRVTSRLLWPMTTQCPGGDKGKKEPNPNPAGSERTLPPRPAPPGSRPSWPSPDPRIPLWSATIYFSCRPGRAGHGIARHWPATARGACAKSGVFSCEREEKDGRGEYTLGGRCGCSCRPANLRPAWPRRATGGSVTSGARHSAAAGPARPARADAPTPWPPHPCSSG